jgi:hypothetical protein
MMDSLPPYTLFYNLPIPYLYPILLNPLPPNPYPSKPYLLSLILMIEFTSDEDKKLALSFGFTNSGPKDDQTKISAFLIEPFIPPRFFVLEVIYLLSYQYFIIALNLCIQMIYLCNYISRNFLAFTSLNLGSLRTQ